VAGRWGSARPARGSKTLTPLATAVFLQETTEERLELKRYKTQTMTQTFGPRFWSRALIYKPRNIPRRSSPASNWNRSKRRQPGSSTCASVSVYIR
jgi:hypothetical protein